jgi:hypothetical protein
MRAYENNLENILNFNPRYVLLHTGHNDLAFHLRKNPVPKDSSQVTQITLDAATLLQRNHPSAKIILSAPFPRIFTAHSSLPMPDILHYNKTAKRHGTRLRSEAANLNFTTLINNEMWKNKDNLEVKSANLLIDGPHLTQTAKKDMINRWIKKLNTLAPADRKRTQAYP